MTLIEILVIIFCVVVVGSVIGYNIYKRIKHMPSSECSSCKARMNRAVKRMQKDLKKTNNK